MYVVDLTNEFPPNGTTYRGRIHYPLMVDWMIDNCKGKAGADPKRPTRFIFEDPEDAMFFKLTWC